MFQTRTAARRKALQMLYQSQISELSIHEIIHKELYIQDEIGLPCEFTSMLALGTECNLHEIDDLIAKTSANWSVERMPLIDLNILRLAVFEMIYVEDVPFSVTINEAVELAKDYGGDDLSSKFVNGVLGKIAKELVDDAKQQQATDNTSADEYNRFLDGEFTISQDPATDNTSADVPDSAGKSSITAKSEVDV
ncbi:MAG: transcription antitermination factor NusB [Coriobacteriales bacterium]|nr:transcription antitermination factor NusB [Coriobacteriales bacterium]